MWAKLDDRMFRRTLIDVAKDAKLLHLAGLAECAANLTDGVLSPGSLRTIAAMVDVSIDAASELVAAGLWAQREGGGYYIETYLLDNPSRADYERAATASRENGKLGGRPPKPKNLDRNPVGSNLGTLEGTKSKPSGEPKQNLVPVPDPVPVSSDPLPVTHDDAPAERPRVGLVPSDRGDGKPGLTLDPQPGGKKARETSLTQAQIAAFEAWWFGPWPQVRRSNRKQAEEVWRRVNGDGARTEEIMAGTQRQHEQDKWRRGYIPEGHNFLRNERWKDEIDTGTGTTPQRPGAINNANEAIRRIYARDDDHATPAPTGGPLYEGTFTRRA